MTGSDVGIGFDLLASPYLLLNIFLTVLLAGLVLALIADPYVDPARKRIILIILLLAFSLIVQTALDYRLSSGSPHRFLRILVAVYGYSVRPVLVVLVCYIIADGKKTLLSWILIGINAAVYLTAFFSPFAFTFSQDNKFFRGPFGYTCHVITAALLANLVCLTIREYGKERVSGAGIPLFNTLLIVAGVVLDSLSGRNYPVSCLNIAIVICSALYYIWLHLQFVREHEKALQTEHRIETMMAQIQPHFLFNSLTAIRAAYRTDVDRGEQALTQFSEYLRHNMDALTEDRMIPLEKELQHVSHYLSLQQLRFGDKLQVRWELEATALRLPSLTLQPLVENAVTYGVRQNATGSGTVTIASREYEDRYELMVTDDGPGLMTDNELGDSNRSHIGLQNVRERLDLVCGGKLLLHSEPGAGVTATIVIPKEQTK